jgi:hypothetical protein
VYWNNLDNLEKIFQQDTSENMENLFHSSEKYIFTVKIRKMKIRILFHQYFIYKDILNSETCKLIADINIYKQVQRGRSFLVRGYIILP